MNKFIKIFTMFFLITFSSTLYADAPGPVNLSLKGIVDWVRFFQFVEYGTALPLTPSTRGVWFILWVNNEPALYWSNGSEWIPFTTAGVQAGSIDTDALADGAVTTPKIANSAVTSEKLMNGAVTTNKIADNAVTGTKFANNSITTAKLANSSVTSEKLGYLSVGTINIQNGAVTSEKIESTIQNKNLVLNNGATSNPSLSFSSNQTSGLSYDSSSSTVDISISASDKVKIGNSFIDFINIPEGLKISSFSENINIKSDGIHYNDESLSVIFNNDIIASGSVIPSEDIQSELGNSSLRWKNIFSQNGNFTNIETDNIIIDSLLPESDNTSELGTDTLRFKSADLYMLNTDNASVTYNITASNITASQTLTANSVQGFNNNTLTLKSSIIPDVAGSYTLGDYGKELASLNAFVGNFTTLYLGSSGTYVGANMNMYTQNEYVFSFFNGLYPYNNKQLNLGDSNHRWKNFYTTNAVIENVTLEKSIYPSIDNTVEIGTSSYRIKSSDIVNLNTDGLKSQNVETDNLSSNNITVSNDLEVNGTASVTSLLVNGNPVSGVENLKFPRGTLSVDIDCGKYSLRSLGKDLVLFSDAFMMIDYNITDDGNYFTFKSGNASPAIMVMDSEIASLTSLTIRLDYENIMSENSESILFGLEDDYAYHIITLYALNKKLYLRIDNINELMDFNYDGYDWSEEHNIYLTFNINNNNIYYGLNIDGVEVYQNSNSITFTQFNIARVKIGAGYGSGGYYTTLKDYNAKYRRIQIYPYKLNLKEMTSIPLLQPIVDQQRELSKNMTKCPYYTLGEPSTLIGGDFNEGEGFFGEVTGDKFIYGWEVLGQLWGMDMNVIDTKAKFIASFTEVFGSSISYTFTGDSYTALGVSDNLEVEWLKFYDNGYLIFIPKRPLLNNITWYEINNALGGYEGKEIQIPVNRINPIQTYTNKKSVGLVCRMINGGNLQPVIIGNINERGLENNNLCIGSEWNRLMYRICDQIPSDTFSGAIQGYSGGKQFGDNWYNYTGSILGFGASNDLGRVTWCREYCWYQNVLSCCYRSREYGVGHVTYNTPSNRSTNYGFRPALVLKVSNQ